MAEETETLDRSSLPSPEEALRALDESEYSETEFDDLMSLYEDTMTNIQQGEIVEGTVLAVDDNSVVIDIGFKSEGSV
ncbi:MAG TPA: 30S ribosomal protein S1, partial [Candidatus Latescibacteria bacterium]|nr:30S ribosomal protein S1 [Candidatus Latescibacterota bacterium]